MSYIRNIRPNLKVVSLSGNEAYEDDHQERAEVRLYGYSDAFYLRPEEDDRVYFDTRTAAYLLRMEHLMECLMKCGVAHFEHYDEAIKMHRKEFV